MKDLNTIISDYLTYDDTDYAIMITGSWGCGKSYYLSHELSNLINGIEYHGNLDAIGTVKKRWNNWKNKKCKAHFEYAYISLYGLASVEDFYVKVFCGLNRWADNGLVGLILATGMKHIGIEASRSDIKTVTNVSKNTVLIFDDLERVLVPVKEVFGLINSYAEHGHHKVIVVCHEDKYLKDSDYVSYKEKNFRFTYKYKADISVVYDTIISKIADTDYKTYFSTPTIKDLVLDLFRLGGNDNLRTLKFVIEIFHKIYLLVTANLKYRDKIIRNLLVSTMIYSMEYKSGEDKEQLERLKEKFEIDLSFFSTKHNDTETVSKKSISEICNEKYGSYFTQEMRQYKCIIFYVINGYLDLEAISKSIKELNDVYLREEGSPASRVYLKLQSMSTISDYEVIPAIKEMLGYVKEGKYNLYDLLNVYSLLLKYHYINICGFQITDEIDELFREAMDLTAQYHVYNPSFDIKTPIWDSRDTRTDILDKYRKIKDYASCINYKQNVKIVEKECEKFVNAAENGDIEALIAYRNNSDAMICLKDLDWSRVSKVLLDGPNKVACELVTCIEYIMNSGCIYPEAREKVMSQLMNWLPDYVEKGDGRVRYFYLTELYNHMKDILLGTNN
ncbi:MAG: KAP family NTPase [Paludibacteraceae bacterium]|nr:KAP family NTPase [Paludibacteraceae bacterium]